MWELVLYSDGCVSVLLKLWYTRLLGAFISDRTRDISQYFEGTSQFLSLQIGASHHVRRGAKVLTGLVANSGIPFRAILSFITAIGPVTDASQHIQAAYLEFLPSRPDTPCCPQ